MDDPYKVDHTGERTAYPPRTNTFSDFNRVDVADLWYLYITPSIVNGGNSVTKFLFSQLSKSVVATASPFGIIIDAKGVNLLEPGSKISDKKVVAGETFLSTTPGNADEVMHP